MLRKIIEISACDDSVKNVNLHFQFLCVTLKNGSPESPESHSNNLEDFEMKN